MVRIVDRTTIELANIATISFTLKNLSFYSIFSKLFASAAFLIWGTVSWLSKRQKTVESSTYGSEMVASRIAIEQIIALRYCLYMIGVNLEPTSVLVGDNMAVVLNTTIPSSALKKKHQACNYHKVRESIAAGFIRYGHIKSEENVADLLTKPLSKAVFLRLCSKYIFRRAESPKDGSHNDRYPP